MLWHDYEHFRASLCANMEFMSLFHMNVTWSLQGWFTTSENIVTRQPHYYSPPLGRRGQRSWLKYGFTVSIVQSTASTIVTRLRDDSRCMMSFSTVVLVCMIPSFCDFLWSSPFLYWTMSGLLRRFTAYIRIGQHAYAGSRLL
jgi:hypothetical protein